MLLPVLDQSLRSSAHIRDYAHRHACTAEFCPQHAACSILILVH
eukprot:SAG31_NODE_32626_length_353_cov_1.003937_1_plen_43_part_01